MMKENITYNEKKINQNRPKADTDIRGGNKRYYKLLYIIHSTGSKT